MRWPVMSGLFIGVPLIEIYLFIKVGAVIGALPTVLLVIVTALAGVSLLRAQGLRTLARLQREVSTGQLPAAAMLEGAALIAGGALLLTPGFLTDAMGFLCLVPITRRSIIAYLINNITVTSSRFYAQSSASRRHDPNVIEGEYRKSDQDR